MILIAAVDDEFHVLERFERITLEFKEITLCGLFETGGQLLDYLKDQPLDAVFLDIEMPDTRGFQLSEQILDLNENIDIIFVTAFDQYAVEAFEYEAMDYILKPLTKERLGKTINRLLKTKTKMNQSEKPFIQCFGEFEVLIGGDVLPWKNSKAKEVLAFLVHKNGVPVNWEKIADAVWPDYDCQRAQKNFHATTYLLRKGLAEAGISQILECRRGNYRVVTEQFNCDLYQFEEKINGNMMKRKEDIRLLSELYQRRYLEENGYDWAYPRAAKLENMCIDMMAYLKKRK